MRARIIYKSYAIVFRGFVWFEMVFWSVNDKAKYFNSIWWLTCMTHVAPVLRKLCMYLRHTQTKYLFLWYRNSGWKSATKKANFGKGGSTGKFDVFQTRKRMQKSFIQKRRKAKQGWIPNLFGTFKTSDSRNIISKWKGWMRDFFVSLQRCHVWLPSDIFLTW